MPADNAAAATAQNTGKTNSEFGIRNSESPTAVTPEGDAAGAVQLDGQTTPETQPAEPSFTEGLLDRLGIEGEARDVVLKKAPEEPVTSDQGPVTSEEETRGQEDGTAAVPPEDHEEPAGKEQWPKEAIALKDKYRHQRNEARDEAKELQEKVQELEAQLEGAAPVVMQPTVADPLADVMDLATLARTEQALEIIVDHCELHPDGWVANEGTPQERVVTAEEARLARVEAQRGLRAVPKKEKQLQARPPFDAEAVKIMPSMFERGTDDFQAAQKALRENSWLARDPQQNFKLAIYLKGWKQYLAEQDKAGNRPAAQPTNGKASLKDALPPELVEQHRNRGQVPILKSSPPSRPGGSAAPDGKKAASEAMQNVVRDGGSRESIVAALNARRAQRTNTSPTREALV